MPPIKLLVQPFGLDVKIAIDNIDESLTIRDLRAQIATIIGWPQETVTLINLPQRCKISDHSVRGSLQKVKHASFKQGQILLCLSPQHNLYINSLKSDKTQIALDNAGGGGPHVKNYSSCIMFQVRLKCIHLISRGQSIYDAHIRHIYHTYARQPNLKQHLIIHMYDFRDSKYRSPSRLPNRETVLLKIPDGATVGVLKTFINITYDLDIYRERWTPVGAAAVIVKPGKPEDTNFSRRSFLAKGDVKLSDAEHLSEHTTLLVFITSQMPFKIKWY